VVIIDLATPVGGNLVSVPQRINRTGVVAGGGRSTPTTQQPFAFRYAYAGGGAHLPVPGPLGNWAYGINNRTPEQIVGTYFGSAVLWERGVMTTLIPSGGGPEGTEDYEAHGINDAGLVVGYRVEGGGSTCRAFVLDTATGSLQTNLFPGSPASAALAVNNRGEVVGYASARGDVWDSRDVRGKRAFLYGSGRIIDINGGATWSAANAITDSGEVVGTAYFGGSPSRAFLYTAAGGVRDIHTRSDFTESTGLGIHPDGGTVFGAMGTASGPSVAFAWTQAGGMVDLNTLNSTPGWVLNRAYGCDQTLTFIICVGTHNGKDAQACILYDPF
jgi:probable HAF family extracellular repeat protein